MWHLPHLLFGRLTGPSFSLWLARTLASAFIYTWVYNPTGGSILLAALLHGAINGGTELVTGLLPGLDDELHVALYGAVALAFTSPPSSTGVVCGRVLTDRVRNPARSSTSAGTAGPV